MSCVSKANSQNVEEMHPQDAGSERQHCENPLGNEFGFSVASIFDEIKCIPRAKAVVTWLVPVSRKPKFYGMHTAYEEEWWL